MCKAVSGVDTNGVSFFKELKKTTAKKNIEVVKFANPVFVTKPKNLITFWSKPDIYVV